MIIYKCDKCGERLYISRLIAVTIEEKDAPDVQEDEFHLCPDCLKELREWLEDEDDLR